MGPARSIASRWSPLPCARTGSRRPDPAELTAVCPGLDAFRTRLVLQTADEDASQALLGAAGAEELPPGGSMLLRLEARTPLRAHGFRVAPDHLARLVALMEQRHPTIVSAPEPASATTVSIQDATKLLPSRTSPP